MRMQPGKARARGMPKRAPSPKAKKPIVAAKGKARGRSEGFKPGLIFCEVEGRLGRPATARARRARTPTLAVCQSCMTTSHDSAG